MGCAGVQNTEKKRSLNMIRYTIKISLILLLLLIWPVISGIQAAERYETSTVKVPILLYHRFGPVAADGMTTTTAVFKSHLEYLTSHGYTVIPLRTLVNYYLHKGPPPPPKSVVITADDAHISVYTDMLPLVMKYHIPVSVFVYPSAISNAKYAMTWNQLRELQKTCLFDMQGHTYWHPNFRKDRKRLSDVEYKNFVGMQLIKSKTKLEKELGTKIDLLAWPFGIHDEYLLNRASETGYVATLTIEAHSANGSDNVMKLPRYLLTDKNRGRGFEWIFSN
jgi:peptidoglycan/xylan/chitin deacetylase (PgdA/CDA1 family)